MNEAEVAELRAEAKRYREERDVLRNDLRHCQEMAQRRTDAAFEEEVERVTAEAKGRLITQARNLAILLGLLGTVAGALGYVSLRDLVRDRIDERIRTDRAFVEELPKEVIAASIEVRTAMQKMTSDLEHDVRRAEARIKEFDAVLKVDPNDILSRVDALNKMELEAEELVVMKRQILAQARQAADIERESRAAATSARAQIDTLNDHIARLDQQVEELIQAVNAMKSQPATRGNS